MEITIVKKMDLLCICVHLGTNVYVHVRVYMWGVCVYTCAHVCILCGLYCVHVWFCIVCMSVCLCVYLYVDIHVCLCVYMCICVCICMYVYTHICICR